MQPAAVTFDIGGIIYSDDVFKRAIFQALTEIKGDIDHQLFDKIYFDHLRSQSGSLRSKLCLAFLGSLDQKELLMQKATQRWIFQESDLYADAKHCILEIKKIGCKIGIVANQAATVVDALERDSIAPLIDFMGVSALVGIEKPNPAIFTAALAALDVKAEEVIHIGNRLDTDVIPAQGIGMRTAWILRGEANPHPSDADRAVPNIVSHSLLEIPMLIRELV